jgi:hypothetical protein
VFFTIVRMEFLLCGQNPTAMFLTAGKGDMGISQNSKKYNKRGLINQRTKKQFIIF